MDRSRQLQNKRPIGANGQGAPTGPSMQRAQMGQQQVYQQPQQLQGWGQPAQPQMQPWPVQQQAGGYVQAPQQYAPPQQQPQQQPQQLYVQQPQPAPQAMYNGVGTQQRPYGAPQTSTSTSTFGGPNQYALQQPAVQSGYAPPGQVPSFTAFQPHCGLIRGVLQSLSFARASGICS